MCKTVLITELPAVSPRHCTLFCKGRLAGCLKLSSECGTLNETKALVYKGGAKCAIFPADVSDYTQTEKMFGDIEQTFGGVVFIINNAGIL